MSSSSKFTCDVCKFTTSADPVADKWYRALMTPTIFATFAWKASFSVSEQSCISSLAGASGELLDICTPACLLATLNSFNKTIYSAALPITLPALPGTTA